LTLFRTGCFVLSVTLLQALGMLRDRKRKVVSALDVELGASADGVEGTAAEKLLVVQVKPRLRRRKYGRCERERGRERG
jgi:hypothetical protein